MITPSCELLLTWRSSSHNHNCWLAPPSPLSTNFSPPWKPLPLQSFTLLMLSPFTAYIGELGKSGRWAVGGQSADAFLAGQKRWCNIFQNSGGIPCLQPAHTYTNNISAIIRINDLDRSETFDRLFTHWPPLIQKCYRKLPAIITGNKMDLHSSLHQIPPRLRKLINMI